MLTPIASTRPNLILLDLNLPGTDGRRSLAKVKGEMKNLKNDSSRDFETTSSNPKDN